MVGLGTVGEAFLRLAHAAGHRVIGVDTDPDAVARADRRLKASAGADTAGETHLTDDLAALSGADVVIEAVGDDLADKARLLRRIGGLSPAPVVTTTAGLSLAELAIASGRPGTLAGLRFLVPPGPGGTVEAVTTTLTAPATTTAVQSLIASLGLKPVSSLGVQPATDATALVLAQLNRAVSFLEAGHATRDDIDTAMRLGCGLPAGPLRLLDTFGLDTAHSLLTGLHHATGQACFRPAPLLSRLVATGRLGRKSGEGFHTWDDEGRTVHDTTALAPAGTATRHVRTVAVVGSGTMARGIAEVCATAGHPTVLVARSDDKAAAALAAIEQSLTRSVRRGRVTAQQKAAALAALTPAATVDAVSGRDLVIEAVAEDLAVKRDLFARLGRLTAAHGTILATTTSSLPVATCAEASGRAADTIGLHFFNPAPALRLVEVVRTPDTTDAVHAAANAFVGGLGKTAVTCPDRAGFIVNCLLFPYLGQAVRLLHRPGTSIDAIDAAVRDGFGYPMGPFELLDTIGLDVSLAIQQRLYDDLADPDQEPAPLLAALAGTGALGRKNGRGFRTATAA
ncbi:oxidoreductase [Streptomyces mangrovisoli]|uniref:Oxidoreductase n=1 Tax=Streptomyces mangrovisoli TaxID=1428628 RepID=A0A1J4P0W2_9ACTN|nr:oxidoreductase [Streptomyces mangrovisoli]